MPSALVCASHSPLMYCYAKAPEDHDLVNALFAQRAAEIRAYDPELVFVFGPDHYTSFFRRLAPPFCVGVAGQAIADIGGHHGSLRVPQNLAIACVSALHGDGIDVAISYDLSVDHGISQTLTRVLGGVDAFPVIPIAFNIMTPPLPPFRRSRMLGETVGRFARGLGKRVLFIGSGGLSHNPTQIFPLFGTADVQITNHQKDGPGGSETKLASWLDYLDTVHREGAVVLASPEASPADCMLNRTRDLEFLDLVTSGRIEQVDAWNPAELISEAGIGSVEIYTWIAACSAHMAAGGRLPIKDLYSQAVEYGVAVGMVHA